MKLSELFDLLSHGEFRRFAIGGSEESGIQPKDYPKVLTHINLGLTEIYKRFPMKTKQVTIQQFPQISNYILHERYAESNTESTEPVKYIMDSIFKPFSDSDEVLAIDSVYKEDGSAYVLNDGADKYSIFTPTFNTVSVPYADSNNAMTVVYRAGHPSLKLLDSDVNCLAQDVEISGTHLEALLQYINGRMLSTQGTPEAMNEGILASQRFQASCSLIGDNGLYTAERTTNEKLENNGWV